MSPVHHAVPQEVEPVGVAVGAGLYPVVRTPLLRTAPPVRDLGVPIVAAPAEPPPATSRWEAARSVLRVRLGTGR